MHKRSSALVGLACAMAGFMTYAATPPPCAAGSGYQPLCGIEPPEDLVLSPDGRYLLMGITPGLSGQHASRLRIMDLATQQARDLPLSVAPQAGWGEESCAAPDKLLGAHGIHLSPRVDGRQQLLVVNHNGREAIEFLELKPLDGSWVAVWHGCVEQRGSGRFNDVAATPGGGLVATVMFESDSMAPAIPLEQLLDGRDTGYLMTWAPGLPLVKVKGSDAPFPNGVQVSADGRQAWFAAWTAKEVRQFDLQQGTTRQRIVLDFMPDNLSWTAKGQLLAAGIEDPDVFRACFKARDEHCASAFQVALIDPEQATAEVLFKAPPGLLAGASVALEVGTKLFVGAYTGDRLLKLDGMPESIRQGRSDPESITGSQ
ncbi:SMP-30/gluconolactonase/LRE family protein [Pseudomonas fluorescens]|uniref:SMP-30/Gluconolactonase/LRE-like region domain-containing protein n=1 Tax=Pseudomonas fluorescens TaxID=294 RepID=A0A5E7EV71_PSEFL|nr:SMP-30/gluconolactonase/LRE family protein [Pseudomonas fluorescens]VVO30835.1 hypothetical protein PS691_04929 [Pseudomonas fluorescens]